MIAATSMVGRTPFGVSGESELGAQAIKSIQETHAGVSHFPAEAQLRQGVAGHHDGDENGGHEVGEHEHAVLSDLRVGDAFHAAQHRVNENDEGADEDAGIDIHFQEAGEYDADAAHLTRDIGERDDDGAHDGDHAGDLRVIAVPDEIGHGEFTELAQVRGQ